MKKFIYVATVFLLTGCANKLIILDEASNFYNSDRQQKATLFYFFDEFGTNETLEAKKLCPNGVSALLYEKTLVDTIFSAITFTVFTPRTITFYCKNKKN